jgi:hypothetical protein
MDGIEGIPGTALVSYRINPVPPTMIKLSEIV